MAAYLNKFFWTLNSYIYKAAPSTPSTTPPPNPATSTALTTIANPPQNQVSGPRLHTKALTVVTGAGSLAYNVFQNGIAGTLVPQVQQLIQGRPTPENIIHLDNYLTKYRQPNATPLTPEEVLEIILLLEGMREHVLQPHVPSDKLQGLLRQIEHFKDQLGNEGAGGASIRLSGHETLRKSAEDLHNNLKDAIDMGGLKQLAKTIKTEFFQKKPHLDLAATRKAIKQLQLAIKQLPEDKIEPYTRKVIGSISQLLSHPLLVFKQSYNPTPVQLETLRRCSNILLEIGNPQNRPSIYTINQTLSDSLSIIETHYDEQSSVLAAAKDEVLEIITDVTSSITGGSGPSLSGDSLSLGGILEGALGVLKKGFAKAQQASTSTFSSYLLYVLLEIKKRIQNDPNSDKAAKALNELIPHVDEAVKSGSLGQLKEVISACLEIVKQNPVYVNGRLLLGSAEDTEETGIQKLMDNIRITESRPIVATREPQHYAQILEIEKQKLVKNASQFGAIQFTYEQGLFGLGQVPLKKDEYLRLIDGKDEETIQKEFFAKIDDTQCNWLRKGWIKYVVFPFVRWIARLSLNETAGQFLKVINSLIQKNATNEFKDVGNHTITNFTRYLETLASAYERVAKEPIVASTLSESLDRELGRKECILVAGQPLTPKELYDKASEIAAKHFTPSITWSGSIFNRWKEWNVIGKLLGWPLFVLGEPCILLGQWIANSVLQFGYSTFLVRTQTINNIVTNSVNAFGDNINGPKHAILSVIYERLEKVLKLLHDENTKGNAAPTAPAGNKGLQENLSPFNTIQLTRLVKNLLDVVEKNKKLTRSDLRQMIDDPSLKERGQKTIEDIFLPKVVETATTLIAAAFQSVLNRNEVESQMCNLMQVINNGFIPGTPISEGEIKAKEQGIKKISDQILQLSIHMAIDKNADFTNTKQQKQSDDFINDMQNQTQILIRDTREKIRAARIEFQPGRSHNVIAQIDQTVRDFTQFNETRIHKTYDANSNSDFNDDTRRRFDKMTGDLADQLKPLGKNLVEVQALQHPRITHPQTIAALESIRTGISEIFAITSRDFNSQEIHECKLKLEILSNTLNGLQVDSTQQSLISILKEHVRKARISLNVLHDQRTVSDILNDLRAPEEAASLIGQLVDKKKQLFNQRNTYSHETIQLREGISRQLERLPASDSKNNLLRTFWNLERSSRMEELNAHFAEYSREFHAAKLAAQTLTEQNKSTVDACYAGMRTHISKCIDNDADKVRSHVDKTLWELDRAEESLTALETWSKDNIKPIYAQDFQLFEFDTALEIAKKFAFSRAKERSEGLMQLVQDPLTLKYGVFHHSLLVPFCEHFGK